MSDSSMNWLVKSNGRILGPFKKDQVDGLLRSGEIFVLDEAAESFHRWRYIRDHEDFVDIVEDVRKLNLGSKGEHTFTMSSLGQTQSITEGIRNDTEEITHDLSDPRTEEIVVTDLEEESGSGTVVAKQPSNFVPAAEQAQIVKGSTDWASRTLWVLAITVIVGVAGYVFYVRNNPTNQPKEKLTDEYLKEGLEHYYVGDHSKAMEPLLKAYEKDGTNMKVASLLAPVLVQNGVEGYTKAQRMIDDLVQPGSEYRARGYIVQGLLETKRGEFKRAREALLKAVELDPFSWQAFSNLGAVAFLEADYVSAKNFFDTALKIELKQSTSRGEAYLMRAQSELKLWRQKKDERYLNQALSGIQSYLNEFEDYKQEALLLKAFSEYAKRDFEAAKASVDQLIDTDPFLTEEHAKDPQVYRDDLAWASLLSRCQEIVSGMVTSSHLETLHALCLVQTQNKDIEAQEVINVAINQAPKDPLVQGVFAFVNWNLGSDMKAEMLATKAVEMNSGVLRKLPHIIKAHICESIENFECSLNQWKQVQAIDENSISALAGLATAYFELKQFSRFETTFNSARKYSRYYKPLLRAQVKASKEGIRIRK